MEILNHTTNVMQQQKPLRCLVSLRDWIVLKGRNLVLPHAVRYSLSWARSHYYSCSLLVLNSRLLAGQQQIPTEQDRQVEQAILIQVEERTSWRIDSVTFNRLCVFPQYYFDVNATVVFSSSFLFVFRFKFKINPANSGIYKKKFLTSSRVLVFSYRL